MGTPCSIAIMERHDSIRAIYCNFDGYISRTGTMLKESYTDIDKVRQLIAGGNIRGLETEVELVERYPGAREVPTHTDCMQHWLKEYAGQVQYNYLFDGERWSVNIHGEVDMLGNAKFVELEDID